MEIKDEDYTVTYNEETKLVYFEGIIRLSGAEYKPIVALLDKISKEETDLITIDFRKLEALNSSGITTMAKFILNVKKHNTTTLKIQISKKVGWQKKSIKNFQHLMPSLQIETEE